MLSENGEKSLQCMPDNEIMNEHVSVINFLLNILRKTALAANLH